MDAPVHVTENHLVLVRGVDTKEKKAAVRPFLASFGAHEELYASAKKGVMLVKFERSQAADAFINSLKDRAASAVPVPSELAGVTAGVATARAMPEGLDVATERTRREWKREQSELRGRIVEKDDFGWTLDGPKQVRLLGGMDISFVKENNVDACAALVVMEFPSLKVVFERYEMVKLTKPYIAGFLAFREVPHLLTLLVDLRRTHPHLAPQVVFMDGNGLLHPRACGVASHFGVLADVPTVGVAKTLMYVDGLSVDAVKPAFKAACQHAGDSMDLRGESGRVWGAALRGSEDSTNPIFVSQGHRISLATAVALTRMTSQHRVPEPIRQADLRSRDYLRKHYRPSP